METSIVGGLQLTFYNNYCILQGNENRYKNS